MEACAGWIGRIFGHSFQRFVVKETPPVSLPMLADGQHPLTGVLSIIDRLITREYCVRCARCGRKAE